MPKNGRIMPIELIEGRVVTPGQIVATMNNADLADAMSESKEVVEVMMNAQKELLKEVSA